MKNNLQQVLYTPESRLRRPGQFFQDMGRDLLASRELAWRLFLRNIRAQYRQSLLGYFWAFLPPIATTLTFVFLNSQKILNIKATAIPYPAYVMVGTLLWQGFVDALNSPIRLMNSSKSMLAKINFPREALILAGMGEVLFNFMIRLFLMVFVFFWFKIEIPSTIVLAPAGILALISLGLTIGILLTPLSMLYQDIGRGLAFITGFWFFITPVVYPPPTEWPASLLSNINPVSPLLITTREMLTTGRISDAFGFIVVTGSIAVMMSIGWVIYRLAMPHLIERMSA